MVCAVIAYIFSDRAPGQRESTTEHDSGTHVHHHGHRHGHGGNAHVHRDAGHAGSLGADRDFGVQKVGDVEVKLVITAGPPEVWRITVPGDTRPSRVSVRLSTNDNLVLEETDATEVFRGFHEARLESVLKSLPEDGHITVVVEAEDGEITVLPFPATPQHAGLE